MLKVESEDFARNPIDCLLGIRLNFFEPGRGQFFLQLEYASHVALVKRRAVSGWWGQQVAEVCVLSSQVGLI